MIRHAVIVGGGATGIAVFIALITSESITTKDPVYLKYASAISLVSMVYVVFLSFSAPILQNMGWSPTAYGGGIALTAMGYVAGSMIARYFSKYCNIDSLLVCGAMVCCAGSIIVSLLSLAFAIGLPCFLLFFLMVPQTVKLCGETP